MQYAILYILTLSVTYYYVDGWWFGHQPVLMTKDIKIRAPVICSYSVS